MSDKIEEFPEISQFILYITVGVIILGQWQISNKDIKILYSLAMLVGSAVGRYGTTIMHNQSRFEKDVFNVRRRFSAYNILSLFGLLGIILNL